MPNYPASGNNPTLSDYLAIMQSKAMHLESLLSTINYLSVEGACPGERESLCDIAQGLAAELNIGLDLPPAKSLTMM